MSVNGAWRMIFHLDSSTGGLYGALRKSDTPSRVKPKEPWPYRVVAGLNRVLEILLDSILEDFI